MARTCYQDTFKKVELAVTTKTFGADVSRLIQLGQQTMSIFDIDHQLENVEQKAELVEPVEIVPLSLDEPDKTMKIGTELTLEEKTKLLEFLKVNRDISAWTTDEMPGIPIEFAVHKLSTDPTRKPVVQKHRLVGPEKQAMKLNLLKCTFAVESGKFLGYVVSKRGIEVNPEKVEVVQQMESPKTIKDVQRLTGCLATLHRFIARLAKKCLPFFRALREPKDFQWTDECQQAFEELKQ
ncbi:hypothetical protein SLEP1_g18713 [Rubroshorea leprosula]|uniref:Reverse transcriptase/retrotransposon-derived protein RNase H-like domain-containing protein n=1 Tax=Rubroshorea leprosula TaxID=152421 RepID=A0AAV5J935_9ROSI|nr:hypothetical protein SLEP1_g18713 [Rubroshorea leprosula]